MKLIKSAVLAFGMLLLAQSTASAQAAKAPTASFADVRAIGIGIVIVGAALGIGNLAKGAVESMARQPETAGNIQTAMIIAAALIEGVTFTALIFIYLETY